MSSSLKSISISGLRSIAGPVTINLPPNGLVLVEGKNEDTGGSSGSGKSNFLSAIALVLDFCPYPSTVLQSWDITHPMAVEGVLETDRGILRIRRGSKARASLADIPIQGGAKAVRETIQQAIGVNPETLALLTYRQQKKPGLFLSKTDAEKKELLTGLLQLSRFEEAAEEAQKSISNLETQLARLEASWNDAKQNLNEALVTDNTEALKAAIEELSVKKVLIEKKRDILLDKKKACNEHLTAQLLQNKSLVKDKYEEAVNVLKVAKSEKLPHITSEVLDKLQANLSLVDKRLAELRAADAQKEAERRTLVLGIQASINACNAKIGAKSGIEREISRLSKELAALENDICPTCTRQWDKAQEKKLDIQKQVASQMEKLEAVTQAQLALTAAKEKLEALPYPTPNPSIEKFAAVESKLNQDIATEKQKQISQAQVVMAERQANLLTLEGAVRTIENDLLKAETEARTVTKFKVDDIDKDIALQDNELSHVNAQISDYQQGLKMTEFKLKNYTVVIAKEAAARAAYEEVDTKIRAEKDYQLLIGREGFLGSIFDEILAEISDETNETLRSVANTRGCTVRFKSENLTQKGTVQKKIVPVVTINGHETTLEAGPSGGMGSVIELAVDLALGNVISRRTGISPGWLILDECLEGLDTVCKESCMDILGKYAENRLVMVVDHNTEFKALFSQVITVRYKDGVSTIET